MQLSPSQQTTDRPAESGVLVTHPFHPLRGRRLPLINRGACDGVEWVLLQLPDGPVLRVPVEWTDLSVPDPYHLAGRGRVRLRVPDLLELRALLAPLLPETRR